MKIKIYAINCNEIYAVKTVKPFSIFRWKMDGGTLKANESFLNL